ncbi:MAG: nuclear transport factor 2 family protein [Candidatus Competibacterales bacterium]
MKLTYIVVVWGLFMAFDATAQSVEDRLAIIETASQLDTAVDAKDWTAVEGLFADRVTFVFGQGEPRQMSGSEIAALWAANLYAEKTSFHLRGDHVVVFEGSDRGTLYSKAYAWNRLEGLPGGDLYEVWGDYTYDVVRHGGTWRITRFAFQPRLERGNTDLPGYRP